MFSIRAAVRAISGIIQVDCYSTGPQVIHPHNAADDISAKVVEHKHFPYGLSLFGDNWRGFWEKAICVAVEMVFGGLCWSTIQVEDLLYRGYIRGKSA